MTVIAGLLAVALVAVVVVFLRRQAEQEKAWMLERRELLNRVQHPEIIPMEQAPQYIVPDDNMDEVGLVGVVQEPSLEDLLAVD